MRLRVIAAIAGLLTVFEFARVSLLQDGDHDAANSAHLRIDKAAPATPAVLLPEGAVEKVELSAVLTAAPTAALSAAPTALPTAPPSAPPSAAPTAALTGAPPPTIPDIPRLRNGDFPSWLPPTPDTPTVGLHGDYEWVYPAELNRTEYVQRRFTANELTTQCVEGSGKPCCALGSRTAMGHVSITGRGLDMNYMMEFQPIPHRPLFSLVDTLRAWRRANPHRRGTKMKLLFLGDSVTGQVFTGAVCELARSSAVEWLTYSSQPLPPFKDPKFASFQETHVKLKRGGQGDDDDDGIEEGEYEVLYIRQMMFSPSPALMPIFLHGADVVLFGVGLHYRCNLHGTPLLLEGLRPIVAGLRETHDPAARNRTLIWLGAPRQHFRHAVDHTQTAGLYEHFGPRKLQFCGPVANTPLDHPLSQSVYTQAFRHFTSVTGPTDLSLPSSWFRWNAKPDELNPPTGLHMHFWPFYELTSPFYENKVSYDPDPQVHGDDCSHILATPNFYESLWDAMYLLIAATIKQEEEEKQVVERFPAGTQQFPNWVPYHSNTSLDYDDVIKQLIQLGY